MAQFDTPLSPEEERQFQEWKKRFAPRDSGEDYDLRGAFKAGLTPDAATGHWADTFKKPNHPTFSVESKYAQFGNPGRWVGDKFMAAAETRMPDGEMIVDVMPDTMTFSQAFSEAQRRNLKFFTWKGREFNTQNAAPVTPPPVPREMNAPDTTQQPMTMGLPQPNTNDIFARIPPEGPGTPDPIAQAWASNFNAIPAGQQAAPSPFFAPTQFGNVMTPPPAPGAPQPQPMMGQGGPAGPIPTATPGPPPSETNAPPAPMSGSGQPIASGTGGSIQGPQIGERLNSLIPPEMNKGPAATPAEAEARVGVWQKVVERVKADPNLLMALVKFGTSLMQPIQPNQTPTGHFGQAVAGGLDYLGTLQNQQSTRALQGAEADRATAAAEGQRVTTGTLIPAQVGQVKANTGLVEATVPRVKAETAHLEALTAIQQADAKQRPALIAAQIKKMEADGTLDEARAKELQTRLKSDPDYQEAMIDYLKSQAEKNRREVDTAKEHFQRFQDLKTAFEAKGYDKPTSILMANQSMFAGGAQRDTNVEDADAQLRVLRNNYEMSKTDPKNKLKDQTFEQFVGGDIAYGSSLGLPPAVKALILARLGKTGRQPTQGTQPAPSQGAPQSQPQGGAPPPAAIQLLREHPEFAPQFEQKYGVKASDYLR